MTLRTVDSHAVRIASTASVDDDLDDGPLPSRVNRDSRITIRHPKFIDRYSPCHSERKV